MPAQTIGNSDSSGFDISQVKEVVVLDIETTGFSLATHAEIIEIGATLLDLQDRRIIRKFHTLIKPSNTFSISPSITAVNGLTWEDVKDAPYIESVLPAFASFIGERLVVAHNAIFDWCRFLVPTFEKVGLHLRNDALCTMRLSKYLYPNRGKKEYNLEALCEMFGHPIEGHHHALTDTMYTASILLQMIRDYRCRYGNILPDSVFVSRKTPSAGVEDFRNLKVFRISTYAGQSKRHGPSIYVNTNIGILCYSVRRGEWSCVKMFSQKDAPVKEWGLRTLRVMGETTEELANSTASKT